MNINFDRWLTTEPSDNFDNWCDQTIDAVSNDFYETFDDWLIADGLGWFEKLFKKGHEPKLAAKIIERTHKLYKL